MSESWSQSVPSDAAILGEPRKGPILIVAPDPAWPRRFETERERISAALGRTAIRVDHVGSTAVPGLPAKPIVDIQVSVPDVEDAPGYTPALEDAGYELRVREPARRMFRTPDVDVHVHVCTTGGQWERLHLLFRDWLRASPADCERYAREKRRLARREWPSMNHYADAKTAVITDIMTRAEAWAASTDWSIEAAG